MSQAPPDAAPLIRPTAVAGLFYPAEPHRLRIVVRALLERAAAAPTAAVPASDAAAPAAAPPQTSAWPKAIIAPHAGDSYSGPIAASVYHRLTPARGQVTRVVMIGPAHRVYVDGLAISGAQAFDTPLGRVPVDQAGVREALKVPGVSILDEAHAPEHSLEVHLPFLLEVLGTFAIVPLVFGRCPPALVAAVLDALWGGPETLILISSDLSHYHDYASAQALDRATTQAIEALRPEDIREEGACGRTAIAGLLAAARQRGLRAATVDLRNSGDTSGQKEQVVGYGAYVFS
jgi:MEMO1 family protein